MLIARTRDYRLIREVLLDPSQRRMASDDATDVANWVPNEDERIIYLEARDDFRRQALGIFTLLPGNAVCYEIHAALLPAAWGYRTRHALRGAIEYAWKQTPARRIVASIPVYNRLAIALGKDAGMTEYGRNPASFLRGGLLHDQVLLGISRPA